MADDEVAPVRVRMEDVRLAGSYNFAHLNIVVMLWTESNVDFKQVYVASLGHPKPKESEAEMAKLSNSFHCLHGK